MKIVVFTGYKQSGKSECAKALIEMGYVRMSFADPLKTMLSTLGVEDEYLYGDKKEEEEVPWLGVTGRKLMQTLGTQWGRKLIKQDLWVKAMEHRIVEIEKEYPDIQIVIDDGRFNDEIMMTRFFGATIIRVTRPEKRIVQRIKRKWFSHESERLPSYYDFEIVNDGTIKQLRDQLRLVIQ